MTAAAMVAAIQALHASLRDSVDLMGIGLAVPRGDTVAEDAAAAGSSGKDVGDVRCARAGAPRVQLWGEGWHQNWEGVLVCAGKAGKSESEPEC